MDKRFLQKLVDDISSKSKLLNKGGINTDNLDAWVKRVNFALTDDHKEYKDESGAPIFWMEEAKHFEGSPSSRHPDMSDAAALIFDIAVAQARRYN